MINSVKQKIEWSVNRSFYEVHLQRNRLYVKYITLKNNNTYPLTLILGNHIAYKPMFLWMSAFINGDFCNLNQQIKFAYLNNTW